MTEPEVLMADIIIGGHHKNVMLVWRWNVTDSYEEKPNGL
jgi:hypothetical protein